MKQFALVVVVLAACSGDDVSGNYDGTVTFTSAGPNAVVPAGAAVDGASIELASDDIDPSVTCLLTTAEDSVDFHCSGGDPCFCDFTDGPGTNWTNLTVTTVTGSVHDDVLTIDVGGDDPATIGAFTVHFQGTFVEGTR